MNEILALLLHDIVLFLAHGAAHNVRAAERIPRKLAENAHDLLLINDAPVGDIQYFGKAWVAVRDFIRVLAIFDVHGDELHRAGAIQRDNGDEVFNAFGVGLHDDTAHTGGFKLEHALCRTARDHFKHVRVVIRRVFHLKARRVFRNHLLGVVDNREVAQAEKVHLEQTELLDGRHRVLRDGRIVVHAQRHVIDDRAVCDDNTGGVRRRVARHALNFACHIEELVHLFVAFI